jgi:glycosyltransferase involved in cell wall biosynthesis
VVIPVERQIPKHAGGPLARWVDNTRDPHVRRQNRDVVPLFAPTPDDVVAGQFIAAVVVGRIHVGENQDAHARLIVAQASDILPHMSTSPSGQRGPGVESRHTATAGPWVLHSMQRWLGLSEQFVHALVSRSRHPGVVVSRFPLEHTDTFPHRPVHSLGLIPTRLPGTATERRLVTAGLLALTARQRPAIVHHHHGYRAKDPLGFVLRRRVPLVLSLHGQDVTTYVPEWPGFFQEVFDLASAVIVPSDFLVEPAIAVGVRPESVVVLPSGVDTGFFNPTPLPEGPPEVVFVGRFVEKKGVDTLLAAWPAVRASVPEATLRLVGYGPLEPLARGAGAGVVVELAQPTQRASQVRDAIRRARVVVTPSHTAADGDAETLLLVNLEAQASGRPLVTTRHGGIPEFVDDGRTALLVPEAEPEALAAALVAVLTDEDLARRLGAAGPAWAAQFDVDACTARVDDLYDRLIGSR